MRKKDKLNVDSTDFMKINERNITGKGYIEYAGTIINMHGRTAGYQQAEMGAGHGNCATVLLLYFRSTY